MPYLDIIKSKIFQTYSDKDFIEKLHQWRAHGKKLVFTNGCFDLLHLGHIEYLSEAASLGDILVVGLNTDYSVQKLKGMNRPITNQESRAYIMASLLFIDAVVLFDEDTPYQLIEQVQPDVLIKGSDYTIEQIIGYDIVTAKGGTVKTIDFVEGYSTSQIVEKIKKMTS